MASFHGNYQPPWMFAQGVAAKPQAVEGTANLYASATQWNQPQATGATWNYLSGMPSGNEPQQGDLYSQGGQFYPPATQQPTYQRLRPNQRYVSLQQTSAPQPQQYNHVAPPMPSPQPYVQSTARQEEFYQPPPAEPLIFAYQQPNNFASTADDVLQIGVDIAVTKNLSDHRAEVNFPNLNHQSVTESLRQPTDPEPPKAPHYTAEDYFTDPFQSDLTSTTVEEPLPTHRVEIAAAVSREGSEEIQWNDEDWVKQQPPRDVAAHYDPLLEPVSDVAEQIAEEESDSSASRDEMEMGAERHHIGMAPDVVSDSHYADETCGYHEEREVDDTPPNFAHPSVDHSSSVQQSHNPPDLWQSYELGAGGADADVANGNVKIDGYPPPDIVERKEADGRSSGEIPHNWSMEDVVLDDSNGTVPGGESTGRSDQPPTLVQHITSAVGQRIQGIASVFTQSNSGADLREIAESLQEPIHVRSESQSLEETAGEAPQLSLGYRSAPEVIPRASFIPNSQVNFSSLTPSTTSPFVQPVMPVPQQHPPAVGNRKRPSNLSVSEIQSYSYFEEALDVANQADVSQPHFMGVGGADVWREEPVEPQRSVDNENVTEAEVPFYEHQESAASDLEVPVDFSSSQVAETPMGMKDVDWDSLNMQLRSNAINTDQYVTDHPVPASSTGATMGSESLVSEPSTQEPIELDMLENITDIVCHEESPDAVADNLVAEVEPHWINDQPDAKNVESDRWSDNWSTDPQIDAQSVIRVDESVDSNLYGLEELPTEQQQQEEIVDASLQQNQWDEDDTDGEDNLVVSENLDEVRNFPVLRDTIEEPPSDNWSTMPDFDDRSVTALTTAHPSVASNLNQLLDSGSSHSPESGLFVAFAEPTVNPGPSENFEGVERRETQGGEDNWSTASQVGDRSVLPQMDSIATNMAKLDAEAWRSWEHASNPVERLAEAFGYSGVEDFSKDEDRNKDWQDELRTARSDSVGSGVGLAHKQVAERLKVSVRQPKEKESPADRSVPPEDPLSSRWTASVPDVPAKLPVVEEISVTTQLHVAAAEEVVSATLVESVPVVSETSATIVKPGPSIAKANHVDSSKQLFSEMNGKSTAEGREKRSDEIPKEAQMYPPSRNGRPTDPQRRYREKVEKNQEYQEIISKRKSRMEATRSVTAATVSLLSPLQDGSSAAPLGVMIAAASVSSSMVSTPQMGSPVPRDDRQWRRETGRREDRPTPQSILKSDANRFETFLSPAESGAGRKTLEEVPQAAAIVMRTNSTPKDDSFEDAARYNDAQLVGATGRNRRKDLTPDISAITAETKMELTRSRTYPNGEGQGNRTRLVNRDDYDDREYGYDEQQPQPPHSRRNYDDPPLVDAERYRVDPYQMPRRPRHGSEYAFDESAQRQRPHSRSSIHSAYDEREAMPRNKRHQNYYRDYDYGQRRPMYEQPGRPRPQSARDPRGFANDYEPSDDDEYSEDEEMRSIHRWQNYQQQYYRRASTEHLDRELQPMELDRLIQMDPQWKVLIFEFRLSHHGRGPTRRELNQLWEISQNQILMQERARRAATEAAARISAAKVAAAAARHIPPATPTVGAQSQPQPTYTAQQKFLCSDDDIRTNSRPLDTEGLSDNDNSIDAASEMSDARPELPAPHLYMSPHMVCRFSPSGALVILNSTRGRVGVPPTTVEIRRLEDNICDMFTKAEIEELRSFPGPLMRPGLNKTAVRSFIQHKLEGLKKLKTHPSGDLDGLILLWRFLETLVITGGNVSTSDIALLLSENFTTDTDEGMVEPSIRVGFSGAYGRDKGTFEDQQFSDSEYPDVPERDYGVELLETSSQTVNPATHHYMGLLMQGEIKDAIDFAVKNNLWEDALSLAFFLGQEFLNSVMMKRIQSMKLNDPRQTLFELKHGRQPLSVTKQPDEQWGDWKPHMAVIVANGNFQSQTDVQSLERMGHTLVDAGKIFSAHLCYLIANYCAGSDVFANFLTLIGEAVRVDDLGVKSVSNDAIQTTEIYEYAIRVRYPHFALLSLQLYKYIYATRLAELGFADEALAYCKTVAEVIVANPSLQQLPLLSCSLCQFDPHVEHFLTSAGHPHVVSLQDWILGLGQILSQPTTDESQKQQVSPAPAAIEQSQLVESPRESITDEVRFPDYHQPPTFQPRGNEHSLVAPMSSAHVFTEPTSPSSPYESANGDYFEGNYASAYPGVTETVDDSDDLGNSTASYTAPFPHQHPPLSASVRPHQPHRLSEHSNTPAPEVQPFYGSHPPRARQDSTSSTHSYKPPVATPIAKQPDIFDMVRQEQQLKATAGLSEPQFKSPRVPAVSVSSPGSDRVFDSPQVEPSRPGRELQRPEPYRSQSQRTDQQPANGRPQTLSDGQVPNDPSKTDKGANNISGPKRTKSFADSLVGLIAKFIPAPPGVTAIDKNLPDDKDPGLVWDGKQWINKSGDSAQQAEVAPPPVIPVAPQAQDNNNGETPNAAGVTTFSIGRTEIRKSASRRYASPTPTANMSVMNGSMEALIPPVAPIAPQPGYFVPQPTQVDDTESFSPFSTGQQDASLNDGSQQPQTPVGRKKPLSPYFQ